MSETQQHHAVGHAFASRPPQFGIAVAFAQSSVADEFFVSLHADLGVHIVAFGFADQRIQHRPRVFALLSRTSNP